MRDLYQVSRSLAKFLAFRLADERGRDAAPIPPAFSPIANPLRFRAHANLTTLGEGYTLPFVAEDVRRERRPERM
jgi:hypothetical protein